MTSSDVEERVNSINTHGLCNHIPNTLSIPFPLSTSTHLQNLLNPEHYFLSSYHQELIQKRSDRFHGGTDSAARAFNSRSRLEVN
jgi:hypothetical protein